MKAASFRPVLQLFVCTNRREAGDPLGAGCSALGEAVWRGLRSRVAARGLAGRVWVTRTLCQGVCPKQGTAVILSPGGTVLTEVVPDDVDTLMARIDAAVRP